MRCPIQNGDVPEFSVSSFTKVCQVPSGNLTLLWKMAIHSGFSHQKWWFSTAMLVITSRYPIKSHLNHNFPMVFLWFSHEFRHFIGKALMAYSILAARCSASSPRSVSSTFRAWDRGDVEEYSAHHMVCMYCIWYIFIWFYMYELVKSMKLK